MILRMGTLLDVVTVSPFGAGSSGSFVELIDLRLFWIAYTATDAVIIEIAPTIPPAIIPIVIVLDCHVDS